MINIFKKNNESRIKESSTARGINIPIQPTIPKMPETKPPKDATK
ncbi:MAG: hypothetical protein K0R15_1654 [Clostridiales bacterium]|jgi:hypothetical protein|nr:hypothetical protein [Clostridiales bacterium]